MGPPCFASPFTRDLKSDPGLDHKFPVLRTAVVFSSPRSSSQFSGSGKLFTMSVPMSFRRSSLSINHLLPIQRLPLRQFSSEQTHSQVPPSAASALGSDHSESSANRTFLKWMSGFATCSGLGFLYWHPAPDLDFSLLKMPVISFSDASAATGEFSFEVPASSGSEVHKLSFPEHSSKFLFGDAYRRKVFFNYEKRMRMRSAPEKVFEYFASVEKPDGELLMRPADLMRAVVPVFPPSESHFVREGYLIGERAPGELRCAPSEFFMLFDVNEDGLISFREYIFFVTLLSIPETSFSIAFKMFDIDHNGEIDREEFKKVMALMRAQNRQGAVHRDGFRPGLKLTGSVENGGLVENFFGKDGNKSLQHDKFVQFMRDLQDEILRLEFAHYDYKGRGTISAKDFALSMVASADINHLDRLLKRVDDLDNEPHLKDVRITFEEFKLFAELRKKLQPFSLALFSYGELNGLLTREDFQRAASHVCGVSVADNVVGIIFHVFDSNRDGNLSSNELLRVMHKRERDIAQPVPSGFFGFLSCCWNCANNGSSTNLFC